MAKQTIIVLYGRKRIKQFSNVPHSGRLNKNKKNRPSSGHFLLIKNNTDIIETRRSYKNLTNRIHEQWEPSNHDLNTGIYQRGKKTPDPNASVDSWLTFSGSQTEEAEGIVDAFAGKYFMGLDARKPVWVFVNNKDADQRIHAG